MNHRMCRNDNFDNIFALCHSHIYLKRSRSKGKNTNNPPESANVTAS